MLVDFVFGIVVDDDVVFFFDYVFQVLSFWIEIDPETKANKLNVMKKKRPNDMIKNIIFISYYNLTYIKVIIKSF